MLPDAKRRCHCTGFTKSCRKLVADGHCQGRWLQVQGANPQTGETISRWECVDSLMPMLLIESTQQQRQTCASIDRLRHETAQRGDAQQEAMIEALAAPTPVTPLIEHRGGNGTSRGDGASLAE
jgi:hypothetical protein